MIGDDSTSEERTDTGPHPQQQNQTGEPEGFLQKILSIFTGGGDPEKEKKRLLKAITKELKKQRYKFYKPRGEEVLPGFAKFIFGIYKILGPAQVLLENAANSGALKAMMIESFLNEKQRKIMENFSEEAIREKAQHSNVKELSEELKEQLVSFFAVFDSNKIKEINNLYKLFLIFMQLVNYDYYFLLKKFDASLPERNFSYSPNFDSISGEYVSEDLKDFVSILPLLEQKADWNKLFDVLQGYKGGQDVIPRNEWTKLLKSILAVHQSNILVLMIKHIDKDPHYKISVYPPREKIVESYLTKLKTQMELTVQKILQERRTGKIEKLAKQVFGTPAVSRMKFYTDRANSAFAKKRLAGFIHVEPMNYLKAFLLDYGKKDIKEIVDVLLIRGKWATNLISNQLSDSFHALLEVSDALIAFDNSLSEEEEVGAKLKNLAHRSDRDQNSYTALKQLLKDTNEQAIGLVRKAAQNLITVAKNLKLAIDDCSKKNPELITNWKELDSAIEGDIKQKMSAVYKQIYYFVQLLQFYVK